MIPSALLSTPNNSLNNLIICLALLIIWGILIWGILKILNAKTISLIMELVFAMIVIIIFMSAEFTVPPRHILIAEIAFAFLCLSLLTTVIYSYNMTVKINDKTDEHIKNRQKLINMMTILLIVMLTAIPFILSSWGSDLLGTYNFNTILKEEQYAHFADTGVMTALFVTVLALYADNILHRITTPIYTYSDIKDIEKFCLYLRPFNKDNSKEEKRICETLKNLFPVYAIGDPNKILQPNGAKRIYVTDTIWHNAVKEMTERSMLTILRIGKTDGTLWELSLLTHPSLINKVIFIAYSLEDLEMFKERVAKPQKIKAECNFPTKGALALYLDNAKNEFKSYTINKSCNITEMLNDYLEDHPELDKIYTEELELRKHNFKYIFNKDRIPESVRKSLNWGIISPIINMRHWSIMAWIIFLIILYSAVIFKSFIPAYIYFLVLFFIGNRIEWATGRYSGPKEFLRKQYREAKIIWGSIILGYLYSVIHIFLHTDINYL